MLDDLVSAAQINSIELHDILWRNWLFVLFWAAIDANNLSCSLKLESILGWVIRGENVLLILHGGSVFDIWSLVNSTLKSSS